MSTTTDTSLKMFRGDDESIVLTVKNAAGVGIDITGFVFWFTVKENVDDTDANASIQKRITSHTTPLSGITTITLSKDDTNLEVKNYVYDIQMRDLSGNVTTLLKGVFVIDKDVTIASS